MTWRNRKLKTVFIGGMIGSAVGAGVGVVVGFALYGGLIRQLYFSLLKGILTGLILSVSVSALEQIVFPFMLRRMNFLPTLLIKTFTYTLLAAAEFWGLSELFGSVLPLRLQMKMVLPAVGITLILCFIGTFIIGINRLLGKRVLLNFFSGRYHKPVEEERIFMFLDLTSSTAIAEQIGHVRFHRFLSDFFFDITDPILEHDGEIYKYVGDEVILVWRVRDKSRNAKCIRCYYAIMDRIGAEEKKYRKDYGRIPEFKAGLHCGTVVAGVIGDCKREIGFLGDVINTAARIQAESKSKGRDILISRGLLDILDLPEGIRAESIGRVRLRGKEEEMELFGLARETKESGLKKRNIAEQ